MTIEKHYSTAQLADILNVHPDTITRLAQKGEIRSSKVGRERRYPESSITTYLDRTATKATGVLADIIPIRPPRKGTA